MDAIHKYGNGMSMFHWFPFFPLALLGSLSHPLIIVDVFLTQIICGLITSLSSCYNIIHLSFSSLSLGRIEFVLLEIA